MAAGPNENQLAVFEALDEEMVQLFHDGESSEKLDKCKDIAKILIGYEELPLGLRCRACIVLAGFEDPGYVEWAQEAVDAADRAWNQSTEHSEAERALRQRAYDCLKQAKEYFEEQGGYHEDGEEDNDNEGDKEDNDNEGPKEEEYVTVRLLASSSTLPAGPDGKVAVNMRKAPAANASEVEGQANETKKGQSIRIDKENGTVEIKDPKTGEWVVADVQIT